MSTNEVERNMLRERIFSRNGGLINEIQRRKTGEGRAKSY
jgi:hypothetical protein